MPDSLAAQDKPSVNKACTAARLGTQEAQQRGKESLRLAPAGGGQQLGPGHLEKDGRIRIRQLFCKTKRETFHLKLFSYEIPYNQS